MSADDVELRRLRERVYGGTGDPPTPDEIARLGALEDVLRRDAVRAPHAPAPKAPSPAVPAPAGPRPLRPTRATGRRGGMPIPTARASSP